MYDLLFALVTRLMFLLVLPVGVGVSKMPKERLSVKNFKIVKFTRKTFQEAPTWLQWRHVTLLSEAALVDAAEQWAPSWQQQIIRV